MVKPYMIDMVQWGDDGVHVFYVENMFMLEAIASGCAYAGVAARHAFRPLVCAPHDLVCNIMGTGYFVKVEFRV
jgi:hypothetical protein